MIKQLKAGKYDKDQNQLKVINICSKTDARKVRSMLVWKLPVGIEFHEILCEVDKNVNE